ncbi:dnaJ homolog subfamily C member 22-like [Haliotis rufescens]|uniref:dnaJ homolog subfamily C member 22-like n=1 Tax=Haliotis rufescens TaxID=6454 RepID=UPI00201EC169|nr:dnaJ homolog subfamily C member 22-like [Haliotis rufescens]
MFLQVIMANLVVAYILWLFGGVFGLHHFYLKRDRHAFVWWATLGGICGLGWIRDVWRLPEYVQECNRDAVWKKQYGRRRREHNTPPWNIIRGAGEIVMGTICYGLVAAILPEIHTYFERDTQFLVVALPQVGAAIGIHLVANIGCQKASLGWIIMGSCIPSPVISSIPSVFLVTILVQWKGVSWRTKPDPKRGFSRRIKTLTFYGTLYLVLWGYVVYKDVPISKINGEKISPRVIILKFLTLTRDFVKSVFNYFRTFGWKRQWRKMKRKYNRVINVFKDLGKWLYNVVRAADWTSKWKDIVKMFVFVLNLFKDFVKGIFNLFEDHGSKRERSKTFWRGAQHPFKVLGLDPGATQKEITHAYRKMSRQWHPDKQKDPQKKEEAHEMFIEIQNAYEKLSHARAKRTAKNKRYN